jgi:hypothetical protein
LSLLTALLCRLSQAIAAKETAESLAASANARVLTLEHSLAAAKQELQHMQKDAGNGVQHSTTLTTDQLDRQSDARAWIHITTWADQNGQPEDSSVSVMGSSLRQSSNNENSTIRAQAARLTGGQGVASPMTEQAVIVDAETLVGDEVSELCASNAQLKAEVERLQKAEHAVERQGSCADCAPGSPADSNAPAEAKGPATPVTASSEAISRSHTAFRGDCPGSSEAPGSGLAEPSERTWASAWRRTPSAGSDSAVADVASRPMPAAERSRSVARALSLEEVPLSGARSGDREDDTADDMSDVFLDASSRAPSNAASIDSDTFFDARSDPDWSQSSDSARNRTVAQLQVCDASSSCAHKCSMPRLCHVQHAHAAGRPGETDAFLRACPDFQEKLTAAQEVIDRLEREKSDAARLAILHGRALETQVPLISLVLWPCSTRTLPLKPANRTALPAPVVPAAMSKPTTVTCSAFCLWNFVLLRPFPGL